MHPPTQLYTHTPLRAPTHRCLRCDPGPFWLCFSQFYSLDVYPQVLQGVLSIDALLVLEPVDQRCGCLARNCGYQIREGSASRYHVTMLPRCHELIPISDVPLLIRSRKTCVCKDVLDGWVYGAQGWGGGGDLGSDTQNRLVHHLRMRA